MQFIFFLGGVFCRLLGSLGADLGPAWGQEKNEDSFTHVPIPPIKVQPVKKISKLKQNSGENIHNEQKQQKYAPKTVQEAHLEAQKAYQ